MNTLKRKNKKGFSLVEVLLALAVLAVAIMSILGLLYATFESVNKNILTTQALTAYSKIDNSLSNVVEILDISGTRVVSDETLKTKPTSFENIYEWIYDKKGGGDATGWSNALFLVCFTRRLNPDIEDSQQRILQVIKVNGADSLPTSEQLNNLDFEGNAFLARIYISPQMAGRYVRMNQKGEVDVGSQYVVGSSLPATSDAYAQASVQVTVDLYPLAIGAAQDKTQQPILSQELVIMR